MTTFIAYAADILMILASAGAAIYCLILSRRLSRLTSFDKGIGGAIAVLSAQVDEMKSALSEAKAGSDGAGQHLQDLVRQANEISTELELMIAACHDFAEEALVVQSGGEVTPPMAASGLDSGQGSGLSVARRNMDIDAEDPEAADDAAASEGSVPHDHPDALVAEGTDPEIASEPVPIFGSRRAEQPEAAVFRRHATAEA